MILLKFFIKITFSLIQLTLFPFINTWKVDSTRCSPCPNILGELPVGIHFNGVNETMGGGIYNFLQFLSCIHQLLGHILLIMEFAVYTIKSWAKESTLTDILGGLC